MTLHDIVYELLYWRLCADETLNERLHETGYKFLQVSFTITSDVHSCLFHAETGIKANPLHSITLL